MKANILLIAAILVCTPITGCDASPASLVGTYARQESGQLIDFIRVARQGEKFVMSVKQGDEWRPAVEITPVSKSAFESMLNEPVTVTFDGLGNKHIAIFQVPKGWRSGQFESKTGFWTITMLGPIELHKR
jgi:hypothetical protein